MAKDITCISTMKGLIIITLLQSCCTVICFSDQIKTGKSLTKTGIHKFYLGARDNVQGNTAQKDQIVMYPHDFSKTRVDYQTTKHGKHLNELSQGNKTNIVSANTKDRVPTSIPGKLNGANIQPLFTFKFKRYFNRDPVPKWTGEITTDRHDKKHRMHSSHYDLPPRRWARSAPSEISHQQLTRHKRDITGDTEVGLILGACVLGLLTAFLLICACVRCNAVRKSEDGKSTVPDYTPTLFAVAKGYDNVAFDTDDCKTDSPSNEIPMIENVSNGQPSQTVSVA